MPIFDQGYQHWSGTLSGHAWRWFTISRQGVRVGMKNPLLRIVVIVSWLPACGLAFILALWGLLEHKSPLALGFTPLLQALFSQGMVADPRHFRVEAWTISFNRFLVIELYFSMLVVLLVGPGLISQDLRFNALPLYFSRPLRRLDYFAGKLGVIAWFLSLVVIIPSLIAYFLGMLFSLDITIVWDTLPLLLACLAYGAVIVLSAGTLILAFSSLSRNSRYIFLSWVAFWFVTMIVAGLLNSVNTQQRRIRRYELEARRYQVQQPMNQHLTREQQIAQQRALREWSQKSREEFVAEEARAARSNWRPLLSYTGNLSRLGEQLLHTNAVWTKVSELEPAEQRDYFLLRKLDPQYPWYWSAGVLAVLFGLSLCLLNYRVRSLDRLK